MELSPLAGRAPEPRMLVDVPRLVTAYYALRPEPLSPGERVAFGTSGHRGSSLDCAFNEAHILAITQAICLYRRERRISGPLFLGVDTHALSEPAFATALEVLGANEVEVMVDRERGYTPTPVVSHAVLTHNRGRGTGLADGIVISPSHNPPRDGGFKYNPPHGGPADTATTKWIEEQANRLLAEGLRGIARIPFEAALRAAHRHDYVGSYVGDLGAVVDLESVRSSKVRIGVDPLGGASVGYWAAVAERHRLDITVVNDAVDPTFRFMTVDWDGKIRMDCSSPYAMSRLVGLRERFDIAFGNDTDADRHGVVTRAAGLLKPNHYLAAAVFYLFDGHRPAWRAETGVGKTVVTSSIIDRVAARLKRRLVEVPVGFKWFVDGLLDGTLGFAGEESAGASLLRSDGTVWTTDKDGIVLNLLAAEITAKTGRDPGEVYRGLVGDLGEPVYERLDVAATAEQKAALAGLSAGQVGAAELAGEPIVAILTTTPGTEKPIGGLKVVAENGWFAARPSGTEAVYKIYAESFRGAEHLRRIQEEARALVARALAGPAATGLN